MFCEHTHREPTQKVVPMFLTNMLENVNIVWKYIKNAKKKKCYNENMDQVIKVCNKKLPYE